MTKATKHLSKKIDALADLVTSLEDDHYPTATDRVEALRMILETAESALPHAVKALRAEGAPWEVVGHWLGVSRQAAHERYSESC